MKHPEAIAVPPVTLDEAADRLADEIDPMWGPPERTEPRPVLNTSGDDDDAGAM